MAELKQIKRPVSGAPGQRNAFIDLLRLLFCIFVCLFHYKKKLHFGGGYLGVDFFFILSGFFLMRSFEGKRGELAQRDVYLNCREYLWQRICRFYPHYFAAFVFAVVVRIFVYRQKSVHKFLLNAFWEIAFLQNIGLTGGTELVNSPTWFLCAALFGGYLVWFLLQKCYGFFLHFIVPFSVMFMFCGFNQMAGNMELAHNVIGITTCGMIRGFVELSLGCLTFKAYQYCLGLHIERAVLFRALQSLIEIAAIGFICLMCYREGHTPKDFVLIMIFSALIVSAALNSSLLAALCSSPVIRPILQHAGRLSFSMYLSHMTVINIVNRHPVSMGRYFPNVVLLMAVTVVVSEFMDLSVSGMKNLLHSAAVKCR